VDWAVSARTGATASYALRRLLPVGSPGHDLAVLVLGVNDALRLTPRRRWRARVGSLVDALQQDLRPGGRVVLAGVPDLRRFRTFPQPLRAVLGWHGRGLDRDLRRLAAARPHAVHVAMPDVSWPAVFAEDRFHPNAEAYAAWAAHLAEALYPR
jgi:lysophospholipase L1-like esterase